MYSVSGKLLRTLQLPAAATYSGLAFSSNGQRLAVSNASGVTLFWLATGVRAATIAVNDPIPCGLVFDPVRPFLYVALNSTNRLARIDLNQEVVTEILPVGVAPVGVTVTPGGEKLFVSNWGGRTPLQSDRTALSSGTRMVVDQRGIAASGTVSVIALDTFSIAGSIDVGLHPSGIQASPDGRVVAVANANSDSVSFIDPVLLSAVATTNLTAFPEGYLGSSPTALTFNADASRIYVTCAGNNSVVSLELQNGRYVGSTFAPTDWYPVAIAVSSGPGGDIVFVANAKGVGSRAGQAPFNVGSRLGTLGRIEVGSFGDSKTVSRRNDPFLGAVLPDAAPSDLSTLGIRHVFLIIKENRTYDQVFGDLASGNGDPKLTTYGARVTPNHHLLATQFIALDNFYATGSVSADGHQWITQAMATDYIERSMTAGWSRSYPYSGEDPLAFAPSGFIWDNAMRYGLSVKIFGEFTQAAASYSHTWVEYLQDVQSGMMRYAVPSRSPIASANAIIEKDYPTFALNVPDQFRARIFLDKFQQYVASGNMPNLVLIWLPADHTAGTTPNYPAPEVMVADNDLALGHIVEAISASPYWPESAIFVTEDDAQNGVDHVDGHRTICLVASPYARRGAVDSTIYNQTSVIRTIEDILGLPPMNKFDAAALPMRSVFVVNSDLTPFRAEPNQVTFSRINPPANSLKGQSRKDALASTRMDFSVPDAAPEQALNRILWRSAQGSSKRYPKVPHLPQCMPVDDDDLPTARKR